VPRDEGAAARGAHRREPHRRRPARSRGPLGHTAGLPWQASATHRLADRGPGGRDPPLSPHRRAPARGDARPVVRPAGPAWAGGGPPPSVPASPRQRGGRGLRGAPRGAPGSRAGSPAAHDVAGGHRTAPEGGHEAPPPSRGRRPAGGGLLGRPPAAGARGAPPIGATRHREPPGGANPAPTRPGHQGGPGGSAWAEERTRDSPLPGRPAPAAPPDKTRLGALLPHQGKSRGLGTARRAHRGKAPPRGTPAPPNAIRRLAAETVLAATGPPRGLRPRGPCASPRAPPALSGGAEHAARPGQREPQPLRRRLGLREYAPGTASQRQSATGPVAESAPRALSPLRGVLPTCGPECGGAEQWGAPHFALCHAASAPWTRPGCENAGTRGLPPAREA
jgi:hypothetical protein